MRFLTTYDEDSISDPIECGSGTGATGMAVKGVDYSA